MVHVVSSISYDADLLPHFVEYYLSLGVDSFIISIDERVPGIWDRTATLAAQLPATIRLVPAAERQRQTGIEAHNKEETRQRFVRPGDWMIPADLDEFVQFPCSIAQLLEEMKAADATFVTGFFSDRLAPKGSLTETLRSPSIWKQYPLEAPVSEMLVNCWCQKVTLCRGDCELTSGHHEVTANRRLLATRRCVVHHFKWRKGIIEALQCRVALYEKQRLTVREESKRILSYLEAKGRIAPEEFHAVRGWDPSEMTSKADRVIYTAITNGYDELADPPPASCTGSELVAFTGETKLSRCWRMEPISREFTDPCRNAKVHKILAHRYFPEAKYSLWIDGSVRINTRIPLEKLADTHLSSADIAVFVHRTRTCIYQEAQACIDQGKDAPELIERQMTQYRAENYPSDAGLAECTVVLRRHTERVAQFNESWWDEIKQYSRRDQLSFNYVAWKLGMKYAHFAGRLDDNQLFEVRPHTGQTVRRRTCKGSTGLIPPDSRKMDPREAMEKFRTFRNLKRNGLAESGG